MLWFYVVFFGFCRIVWSNPVPQDLASPDVQSSPDDTTSDLISNEPYVTCTSEIFTNDLAESNSLNTDDLNLWRRGPAFCQNRATSGMGNLIKNRPNPQIVNPDQGPILTKPSNKLCPDPVFIIPVTCAGPEAYVPGSRKGSRILIVVGNCEPGKYYSSHDSNAK